MSQRKEMNKVKVQSAVLGPKSSGEKIGYPN